MPAHDPRLETMSDLECELEVMAYLEAQDILRGKGKKLPSSALMEKIHQLQGKSEPSPQTTVPRPVTPKELGWE